MLMTNYLPGPLSRFLVAEPSVTLSVLKQVSRFHFF